jgi:hypothetical protein
MSTARRTAVALAAIVAVVVIALAGVFDAAASTPTAAHARNAVAAISVDGGQVVGTHPDVLPGERRARAPGYDQTAVGSSVAAEGASEAAPLFRAVESDELADLVGSGQYRTIAGQEGKYFFPTEAQAENFAELMSKGGHGPFCITSGCIDSSLLSGVEQIPIAGEGPAWFIPEELLPYINNIVNLGPAG